MTSDDTFCCREAQPRASRQLSFAVRRVGADDRGMTATSAVGLDDAAALYRTWQERRIRYIRVGMPKPATMSHPNDWRMICANKCSRFRAQMYDCRTAAASDRE